MSGVTRWLLALFVAGGIGLFLPPRLRKWAFRTGRFERRGQTERSRSQRRPTTGGIVAAGAVAAGGLLAGPGDAVGRAALLAAAVALVGAYALDLDKAPDRRTVAGVRIITALVVPLAGVRAELTGTAIVDVALTAALALLVIGGLARTEHADAAAPVAAMLPGLALLVVSARLDETAVACVAAAIAGVGLALLGHMLPPADLRLGRTGPTVLGAALVAAAVAHDPAIAAPDSAAVPVLVLVVPVFAALVPGFTERLARRRVPVLPALSLASLLAGAAGVLCDTGDLEPLAAAVVAGALPALLVLVAVTGSRPSTVAPTPGWVWATVGLIVVGSVAVAGFAGLSLRNARSAMQEGREAAEVGLEAARDGDLDVARASFATADAAFASAQGDLESPLVTTGLAVPVVAQNLRAARELADVGRELTTTAVTVSTRAGASDLLVTAGTFPIAAAESVAADLADALAKLDAAEARLYDVNSPVLVDEVSEGVEAVAARIDEAGDTIRTAAEATSLAPALLGGDGPRTYVVAVLSPSELRGAGGLFGDYAELRAEDGRFDVIRSGGVAELNAVAGPDPLPDTYPDNYAALTPQVFWQNLSATPDGPTFGAAVTGAWPLVADGATADGLIAIDPYGLAALLQLTGPINVADWPEPITSANVAQILLFEQYDELPVDIIDRFQSDVIDATVDAIGSADLGSPAEIAAVLGPAATAGHLSLYSTVPEEQALFADLTIDDALPATDGRDALVVSIQNGSEAKIDWYLRQDLTYDVTVDDATNEVTAVVSITLTNTAPTEGVAEYIIGGAPGSPTEAGENRLSVGILSPLAVTRVSDGGGGPIGATLGTEQGLNLASVVTEIPSGGTATFRFELAGRLDRPYSLRVRPQTAPSPTNATVTVNGETSVVQLAGPMTFDPAAGP